MSASAAWTMRVGLVLPFAWLGAVYGALGALADPIRQLGTLIGMALAIAIAGRWRRGGLRGGLDEYGAAAPVGVQAEADTLAARLGVPACPVRVRVNHRQVASLELGDRGAVVVLDAAVLAWDDDARRAVLGHELAHRRHRHHSTHAIVLVLGAGSAVVGCTWAGLPTLVGVAVAWVVGSSVVGALLAISRRYELAADAAVVMVAPELTEALLDVVDDGTGIGRGWQLLATHPDSARRVAAIDATAGAACVGD